MLQRIMSVPKVHEASRCVEASKLTYDFLAIERIPPCVLDCRRLCCSRRFRYTWSAHDRHWTGQYNRTDVKCTGVVQLRSKKQSPKRFPEDKVLQLSVKFGICDYGEYGCVLVRFSQSGASEVPKFAQKPTWADRKADSKAV